jgi:hypothetical protein
MISANLVSYSTKERGYAMNVANLAREMNLKIKEQIMEQTAKRLHQELHEELDVLRQRLAALDEYNLQELEKIIQNSLTGG